MRDRIDRFASIAPLSCRPRPVRLSFDSGKNAVWQQTCFGPIARRNSTVSSIPFLAPVPLHGNACGIADLNPDAAGTRSIRAVDLLRHDALGYYHSDPAWSDPV